MSWFTETALDGVVGGIIGGAATGGAVWWTLTTERKHDREAELRAAVGQLQAKAYEVILLPVAPTERLEWAKALAGLYADLNLAEARAASDQTRLHDDLAALCQLCAVKVGTGSRFNVDDIRDIAQKTSSVAARWLADPATYNATVAPVLWLDFPDEQPD